jgi:hypothetical protein
MFHYGRWLRKGSFTDENVVVRTEWTAELG